MPLLKQCFNLRGLLRALGLIIWGTCTALWHMSEVRVLPREGGGLLVEAVLWRAQP